MSSPPSRAGARLNVADVARLLGRSRPWVYEHAAELGAFRFGNGPKARLGFDRRRDRAVEARRQIRSSAELGADARTLAQERMPRR